ncbi:hypothetical protein MMPV_007462 [Pyropia vietnamensis]
MGGGRAAALVAVAVAVTAGAASLPRSAGHALMTTPRQRGALKTEFDFPTIDPAAPIDYCPHCLNAGGTGGVAGANGGTWSSYDPLDPGLGPARSGDHGACGDPASAGAGGDHLSGGRFYHGGMTVATYTAGASVDFQVAITTSHNGFMEWWVCDADRCGEKDPSDSCFDVPGACVRLERVPHPACEAGTEMDCGPIQPDHPSRWYLPCRGDPIPTTSNPQVLGGPEGKMRYALPPGFACERCIVQWYWVTANSCTPPGMKEYAFPQAWAGCPGDGGSVGGVRLNSETCGEPGAPWPEEFWTCADVVIKPGGRGGNGGGGGEAAPPTRGPELTKPTLTPSPRRTPMPTPQTTQSPSWPTRAPAKDDPTPSGLPYCIMPSQLPCVPQGPAGTTPPPPPSPPAGRRDGDGGCAAAGHRCAAPRYGIAEVPCCDPEMYCKPASEWHWYCASRRWD